MAYRRGALIVFEGLDHCGKTTQAKLLAEFLTSQQIPYQHLQFPQRTTPTGIKIDAYLKRRLDLTPQEIHKLFSENRWEANQSIRDTLLSGTTVICDRYVPSGLAFSVAKGCDLGWCRSMEKGLVGPDRIIYLDIQPQVAARRCGYGDERYEEIKFQETVRGVYSRLKMERPELWSSFNASQPIAMLQNQIRKEVLLTLGFLENIPLRCI